VCARKRAERFADAPRSACAASIRVCELSALTATISLNRTVRGLPLPRSGQNPTAYPPSAPTSTVLLARFARSAGFRRSMGSPAIVSVTTLTALSQASQSETNRATDSIRR
jgi:hypothetical protein